jgi:nicotinamidase-related amidase
MPLVLSTSLEDKFQGPLLQDLREIAPTAYEERIKRPGVIDAWLYEPFRKAVEKTGRKKIIMAGLTNDMCVLFILQSARFRMDTKSKSWSMPPDHLPRWLTM